MAKGSKKNQGGAATADFQEDPERTTKGNVDTESDAEAEAEINAGPKYKKYPTMIIGIGKTRKDLKAQVDTLATKLGCKTSDLVWIGLERVLKDPPKEAPKGATINAGSAAGFWVVPETNNNGRATNIKVVEVESRSQVTNGRTFFRFDRNDAKSRARAEKQAIQSAQYDAKLLGLKADGLKAEKFKG